MKKKKEEEHENSERWLLSYSDFMTLLMILFVVLYAMSNVDRAKFSQLAQSMNMAMGGGKSIIGNDTAVSIKEDTSNMQTQLQERKEEDKMEDLKAKVDKYLEKNGMKQNATTQIDERGLVVSLNDTMFFDTGSADIKPEAEQKITDLGKILNGLNNYMRIEGHTDNQPIHNAQFASNWQLSAQRAANVTELLIQKSGVPGAKLQAVGYGEYRPILDNSTEEGRARNRRVDIIIVNSKFDKMENQIGTAPLGQNPIDAQKSN